jgi:hypothetical protein
LRKRDSQLIELVKETHAVSIRVRCLVGLLLLAILVAGGVGLLRGGSYGLTIFVVFPVLLGGLASWVFRPANAGQAAGFGALAVMVAVGSLLIVGLEGVICIVMTLPLALPLGALGALLVYRAESSGLATGGGLAMLLLLPPASFTWDVQARPQVFEVRTAIAIAASPEQVWKHVVTFSELPEPQEWFFRAGLAYPKRARIEGSGVGAIRYCEFSTGPFVEPIEVWSEPHLLRFRVTENPAPMNEWSPYARILPKHLHGYLISRQGQFQLTRLPGNRTLLEGTTWYQHGLWPADYWRWWSHAIIHRIHWRVLDHIRALAEADSSGDIISKPPLGQPLGWRER